MPIIDSILAELDHESRATAKVLERVPTERLDWAPHAKSSSLQKLAWHLATIPVRVQAMLQAGTFDMGKAAPLPPPSDASEFAPAYRENLAAIRAYLATLDDAALKEPFTMMRNGEAIMTLPKIAVIRNILCNHSYHHRGQLTVYLRLLDIPVPSIYGPSADEIA